MASSARRRVGRQLGVELVGLGPPAGDDLARSRRRGRPEPPALPPGAAGAAAARPSAPGSHRHQVPEGALGAGPLRVDGGRPADHMVVDPVLGIPGAGCQAVQPAHRSSRCHRTAGSGRSRPGPGPPTSSSSPRNGWVIATCAPPVAASSGLGASTSQDQVLRNQAVGSTWMVAASGPGVGDLDRHQEVVRVRLGVVDLDDPVAVVVEDPGVEQLVLGIPLAAPAVLPHAGRRRERPAAGSGSATGSRRGSAGRPGTTSSP